MDTTARLGLWKPNPDPVTGDDVDVSELNQNADKIDAAISYTVCTSSTRPATPFEGQAIVETDTGNAYVRVSGTWRRMLIVNAAGTQVLISGAELNVTRALATDTLFYGQVTGESTGRLLIRADGRIEIGPGSGSRDITLYRAAANVLKTDDDFQAAGFIAGNAGESIRVAASAAITTTETVIQSLTFNAVAGSKYLVHAVQHIQSTVAGDLAKMRIRWAAGASVTTAGQQAATILPNCETVSRGLPWHIMAMIVPGVTGQVTVGVTLVRDTGTGNISSSGQADRIENTIHVVGA